MAVTKQRKVLENHRILQKSSISLRGSIASASKNANIGQLRALQNRSKIAQNNKRRNEFMTGSKCKARKYHTDKHEQFGQK